MTNNPTIDGVSRELLTNLHKIASRKCKSAWSAGVCDELRALLDAPAVERKEPVAWKVTGRSGLTLCPLYPEWATDDPELKVTPLYDREQDDAGVEFGFDDRSAMVSQDAYSIFLARESALQSTIARLEARITQLEYEKEFAAATYQAARDRIAELESGRGYPVAVVTSVISRKNKRFEIEILDNQKLHVGTWLFTAPPVPVAVVLPERKSDWGREWDSHHTAEVEGWNACLDATAALNKSP